MNNQYLAIPGERDIKQITLKFDEILLAMGDRKNQEAVPGESSPGTADQYSYRVLELFSDYP